MLKKGTFHLGSLLLVVLLLIGCRKSVEDFVAQAKQAEAAGDRTKAIPLYERALRENQNLPTDVREHLADLLLEESRDADAVPHLILLVRSRRNDAALLIRTINLLLELGGPREARKLLADAPDEVLEAPAVKELDAELLVREGKLDDALKELQEIIAAPKTPDDIRDSATLRQARILHQMGHSTEAMKLFDDLLARKPDNLQALQLRANLLMATHKYEEARAAYLDILKHHPEAHEAMLGLASLSVQQHQMDQAIQYYEKSFAADPKDSDVLFWLAELHYEQGHTNELAALRGRAQGRAWQKEVFESYLGGLLQMINKNYQEALNDFLRLKPSLTGYPGLYDKIGLCYLKLGNPTQAEAAFANVPHDEQIQEQVWSALGNGYLSVTNYARAVRWLEVSRGKDRVAPLSQAQFGLGDMRSAYENAILWLQQEPNSVAARLIAAESARRLNIQQQGRIQFEKLAAEAPNSPAGIYARAQLLVSSNDLAGAESLLKGHTELVDKQAGPSLLLAEISLRLDKKEQARKYLQKTLQLDSQYARAHALLALLLQGEGNDAGAVKEFEAALNIDPNDNIALLGRGLMLFNVNRYQEAADLLKKAANLRQPDGDAAIFWALSEFSLNQSKLALEAAEKAVSITPTNAFAHYLEVRGNLMNRKLERATKLAVALNKQWPRYIPGYHALALVALSTNGVQQALAEVQNGLKVQAKSILLQPLEVELLRLEKRQDEAGKRLATLKQDFPNEPDRYLAEVNLLMDGNEYLKAREVCQQGLALNPLEHRLQQRLIDSYVRANQIKDAAPVMEAVLSKDSENTALEFICARLREIRGDWNQAEAHYQAILKKDPKNVACLNNLSLIAGRDKKRLDEAVKLARRAYVLDGKNPLIADSLATLMLETGDARQARILLESAIILAPKNTDIRLHLVEAYIASKFYNEAQKEMNTLAKDAPALQTTEKFKVLSARLASEATEVPAAKTN